jgi:hypothetical protein
MSFVKVSSNIVTSIKYSTIVVYPRQQYMLTANNKKKYISEPIIFMNSNLNFMRSSKISNISLEKGRKIHKRKVQVLNLAPPQENV